jgi:hypothetical protein
LWLTAMYTMLTQISAASDIEIRRRRTIFMR